MRARRMFGRVAVVLVLLVAGLGVQAARSASAAPAGTLVLYDSTGPYGWLGEQYAILAANLSGRFGAVTTRKVTAYRANDIANFQHTIYIGSTYDEPLPNTFLDDVIGGKGQVLWLNNNIWRLTSRQASATGALFWSTHGWDWTGFDTRPIPTVRYKGTDLTRDSVNGSGIMGTLINNPTKATVLATAVTSTGAQLPWAIRSGLLTYIGELPFAYVTETDRYLAFADLLFDAHAPSTPQRHQALIRIEDVSPDSDPNDIRAIADYLASEQVPFSLQVIPRYRDPNAVYQPKRNYVARLVNDPDMIAAYRYAQSKGATLVQHGWTHQLNAELNPYTGASADDFEFYRAYVDADNYVRLSEPNSTDQRWNDNRFQSAVNEVTAAGLQRPQYSTLPHYAGSVATYRSVARMFTAGYERRLYFNGLLTGAAIDYTRPVGQFFPYPVKDVYGGKVVPENLGNEEPEPFNNHPARFPADLVNSAKTNLVVRDGVASFFWHSYLVSDPAAGIAHLQEIVQGIKALGYTFVSPATVLGVLGTGSGVTATIRPIVLDGARPGRGSRADAPAATPEEISVEVRRVPGGRPELGAELQRRPDRGPTVRVIKIDGRRTVRPQKPERARVPEAVS